MREAVEAPNGHRLLRGRELEEAWATEGAVVSVAVVVSEA